MGLQNLCNGTFTMNRLLRHSALQLKHIGVNILLLLGLLSIPFVVHSLHGQNQNQPEITAEAAAQADVLGESTSVYTQTTVQENMNGSMKKITFYTLVTLFSISVISFIRYKVIAARHDKQ